MADAPLASRIRQVTVYTGGALVTRETELLRGSAGWPASVCLDGLPLCVLDGSMLARVEALDGEPASALPLATGVRISLKVPQADPALPQALNRELEDARRALNRLEGRKNHLEVLKNRLNGVKWAERPRHRQGEPPPPVPTAQRLEWMDVVAGEQRRVAEERSKIEEEIEAGRKALGKLEENERLASDSRQTRAHELRKAAWIALQPPELGDGPERVRLVLEYQVPGARWAPAYTLRFTPDYAGAMLQMRAMVCQRTGEDWRGVALTLSTAHLQGWSELPELHSLRIGRRQPPVGKTGWRPAPEGAEKLYKDYDDAFGTPAEQAANRHSHRGLIAGGGTIVAAGGEPGGSSFSMTLTNTMAKRTIDTSVLACLDTKIGVSDAGAMPAEAALDEVVFDDIELSGDEHAQRALPAPSPDSPTLGARRRTSLSSMVSASRVMPTGPAVSRVRQVTARVLPAPPTPVPPRLCPRDEMLNFARLRMGPPDREGRGGLTACSPVEELRLVLQQQVTLSVDVVNTVEIVQREASVAGGTAPAGYRFPSPAHGFDYAYTADAPATLPSDGEFHSLPVAARDGDAKVYFVAVPREAPEVFRYAELLNPIENAPILEGPVDLWCGDDFLMGTNLFEVPPGGMIELGLGVEQGIKAARNAFFEEETGGLLGGSLRLKHRIKVELANNLARPALVEVRERLPVTKEEEEEIKIETGKVAPPWDVYQPGAGSREEKLKGGRRWRVTVEPGRKQTLEAEYAVTIAAKHELEGGNRRES